MRSALLLALIAGCAGPTSANDNAPLATEFVLPSDGYLEFVRFEVEEARVLMVQETAGTWDVRFGLDWTDSDPIDTFTIGVSGGLTVGGQMMLAERVIVGAVTDGVEVVAIDSWEAKYGTFEDTAEVEVVGGDFEGTQAFARDVGPVSLTFSGQNWDLVYYE